MPFKDPVKQKEAKRQWYLRNRELTKKRALDHKHRDQEWFKELKSKEVCKECGESTYELLDYHHRDPSTKVTTVSDMLGRYGRPKVLEEMAKCDVLCKQCHMKHHYNYPFH